MRNIREWAQSTFGGAALRDSRRTHRLVQMASQAARRPAGQVTRVFAESADRQAAYDFLEHEDIQPSALTAALGSSTARECEDLERVLVVLDGTSLTLTDRDERKGLGNIGPIRANARGLKVINALALRMDGTPIGVADQNWWTRRQRAPRKGYRRVHERESARWRECVEHISTHFESNAPHTKLHFLVDREGDAALLMRTIERAGHEFTIRSNGTRKVVGSLAPAGIRSSLAQRAPVAMMRVSLPKTAVRAAREAKLTVRAAQYAVRMRDHHVQDTRLVPLTFVWAREERRGEHIDWLLVTNTSITSSRDACDAVARYAKRWRIEDMHRTWKSGLCHVEATQLRSANAIIKWATILAAVASRAETLRHEARTSPDAPATTILSADEIDALILLKTKIKSRVETVSAEGLTVAKAVRWIADLGGYVGNNNSGKPGPATIARGLEQLIPAAFVIAQFRASGQIR
jgi:hypothetical protein